MGIGKWWWGMDVCKSSKGQFWRKKSSFHSLTQKKYWWNIQLQSPFSLKRTEFSLKISDILIYQVCSKSIKVIIKNSRAVMFVQALCQSIFLVTSPEALSQPTPSHTNMVESNLCQFFFLHQMGPCSPFIYWFIYIISNRPVFKSSYIVLSVICFM